MISIVIKLELFNTGLEMISVLLRLTHGGLHVFYFQQTLLHHFEVAIKGLGRARSTYMLRVKLIESLRVIDDTN